MLTPSWLARQPQGILQPEEQELKCFGEEYLADETSEVWLLDYLLAGAILHI